LTVLRTGAFELGLEAFARVEMRCGAFGWSFTYGSPLVGWIFGLSR